MPVDPTQQGRVFPPTAPRPVTAEAVDAFNAAVSAPPGPAAPTFPFTFAVQAWQALFDAEDLDIELHRLVHADQRFSMQRALAPGDEVVAQATLTDVRPAPGADRLVVATEIRTTAGELVGVATSTLLCSHRPSPTQADG
jgi:N-terminal half of MaoC dehydratase